MRRILLRLWLCFVLLSSLPSPCSAQNVSGYSMIPEPLLFLLREPAVHDDLNLSQAQKAHLLAINESFDHVLLATRNIPPKEGQKKVAKVVSETRAQVAKLLSTEQQERVRQITYRLRGISFVVAPYAAEQLQLSEPQREQIEAVIKRTHEELGKLQTATYQGKEAHEKVQNATAAARKEEQQEILSFLDDQQKKRLLTLIGKPFDASSLGKVSFKAPELSTGNEWINSSALRLEDLRGKVVAVHFWAFG